MDEPSDHLPISRTIESQRSACSVVTRGEADRGYGPV